MSNLAQPPDGAPYPAPDVPAWMDPARYREFWATVEELAAARGLPPLPVPE